jgi:hypothetical protein
MIPKEIKKIIQEADPQAGVSTKARKSKPEGQSGEQKFEYRFSTDNPVRDAVEVEGAAKKSIAAQCGHPPALSDNAPHSNSGGDSNSATDPGNYKKR